MEDGIDFSQLGRSLGEFSAAESLYLIEDLVYHPSLALLYAPSGGQKSLLALDMARAIATGGEFLGFQCTQMPVAYVDGEMSDRSIRMRSEAMEMTGLTKEEFFYITPQGQEMDFAKPETREKFLEFIFYTNYRFVVFDNLRVLTSLTDENDAASFTLFNRFIRQLRDFGVSVLVIHHSNKDGATYAGSSNLLTVFDAAIGLSGQEDQPDKLIKIGKGSRDDTNLNRLSGQYVRYKPTGFVLNEHAGACIDTAVGLLVQAIKIGEVKTSRDCSAFLRKQGVPINNDGWSLNTLYQNYIKPYYIGGDLNSLTALKELLSQARS